MEITEILRIIGEVLVLGVAAYLKNKISVNKKTHLRELNSYQLTVDNLKFENKQLTENKTKLESLVKKSK